MDRIIATLMAAVIASLSISGFAANEAVSESDFEAAIAETFICDLTGEDEICKQVSKTLYTCYPYAENRTGAKRCGTSENKGSWVSLREYADDLGVNPFTLYIEMITRVDSTSGAGQAQTIEKCTPSGCVKI